MDREVNLYDKLKREQIRGLARATANNNHNLNPGSDASAGSSLESGASPVPGSNSGSGLGLGLGYGVKPRPVRTYDFNFTEGDPPLHDLIDVPPKKTRLNECTPPLVYMALTRLLIHIPHIPLTCPFRTYDFKFTEDDEWVVSEGEYIDEDERR